MKHHYPDCQGGPDCRCDERDSQDSGDLFTPTNKSANLEGYGYTKSDSDGFDSGHLDSVVSPIQHKEEEFFEALRVILGAKPIE